jgi:hypothetical protein
LDFKSGRQSGVERKISATSGEFVILRFDGTKKPPGGEPGGWSLSPQSPGVSREALPVALPV